MNTFMTLCGVVSTALLAGLAAAYLVAGVQLSASTYFFLLAGAAGSLAWHRSGRQS